MPFPKRFSKAEMHGGGHHEPDADNMGGPRDYDEDDPLGSGPPPQMHNPHAAALVHIVAGERKHAQKRRAAGVLQHMPGAAPAAAPEPDADDEHIEKLRQLLGRG